MMTDSETRKLFNKHIEIYYEDVYRIILNSIQNSDIAEEMTQTVMLKAWQSFHTLKDLDKSKEWVKAITRNVIREHLRKVKKQRERNFLVEEMDRFSSDTEIEDLCQLESDVLDMLTKREDYAMIGQALRSLDTIYQDILRENIIGEVPLKEIAESHGMKYGTVRVMYTRGLKLLKNAFLKLERGGKLNG